MEASFNTQVTLEQIPDMAALFLKHFEKQRVFAFFGEMGVGKTTFIKALCQQLQVENITSSPTFAIVNEYNTQNNGKVYHFDFYRIEDQREALDLGFFDYLESGNYCFMEWSENIETLLQGEEYVKVTLTRNNDLARAIQATIVQ